MASTTSALPIPVAPGWDALEDEMHRLLRAHAAAERTALGPMWQHLETEIHTHLVGGKLLRPTLLLAAHAALAEPGAEPDDATVLLVAAAVELLHFSFLLHDDVIDGDHLRRGSPNLLGAIENDALGAGIDPCASVHWARSGGILTGDVVLAVVHQAFARLECPAPVRLALLDLLQHTVVTSVAGEAADVGLSNGLAHAGLDAVLSMSVDKTAVYTFELPMRAAAVLAGAPATIHAPLVRIARALGLAFQLQDDLLSTLGDPARHGKSALSDLREGKRTALMECARQTDGWHEIAPYLERRDLDPADLARVQGLLRTTGAARRVEEMIEDQLALIARLSDGPDVPPALGAVVADLAGSLRGRGA